MHQVRAQLSDDALDQQNTAIQQILEQELHSRNIPSGQATDKALLHSCTGTKNSAARVIPGLTCKATASRLRSFLQNLMRSSPGSIAGAAGRAGALSASFRFMEPPSSRALLSRRAGRWTGRACRICKSHNPSLGYVSQACH